MLKIKRINGNGQEVEAIIDPSKFIGSTEVKHTKPVYDVNTGEFVKNEETESTYTLFFEEHNQINVSKETYDKLVAKLNVEEL